MVFPAKTYQLSEGPLPRLTPLTLHFSALSFTTEEPKLYASLSFLSNMYDSACAPQRAGVWQDIYPANLTAFYQKGSWFF